MTDIQFHPRKKRIKNKCLPYNIKLVLKDDKPRRMTPSAYTQEMLQSTEERLASTTEMQPPRILELLDMSMTTHQTLTVVDMDQPLFQPFPSTLIFQNVTPGQTYKLPLQLFNKDKVLRQVKVELQDTEYFQVIGPQDARSKVAPGISATFTVFFTPQESKDYHHSLICVTERERFEVSIHGIGPRAILDFPDEINLPVCPVKTSTQRTHLVRNIGNSEAKFTLHTQSPFSVTPSSGTIAVGEAMQVTVDFNPNTVGDHSQNLLLHYHTGEDVYIRLYGVCEEVDVHLEPDFVLLKKTYVSMANVHTVSLINRSEIPLKYCWVIWPSLPEEALHLLRDSSVLQKKEGEELERLLCQCESDPTAIHRLPLLSRALQERRTQGVKDHAFALSNSCITVEPAEGEIWPNMTAQFNIVFKPEEATLYTQNIYCDVAGRESLLPLALMGEGMGPKLQLNYNVMDMKNVFIGDKDYYEVLLSNTGLTDAPFSLSSPDTTYGHCFSFSPEEGVVPSGASQIVTVTFHSQTLGTFSEDLLLTVTGQPQPLTLTFRGCVIGPAFHFNISEFNFGDVAFGCPHTLICTLFNTSFVPMNFTLRVPEDGLGSCSVNFSNWQGCSAKDVHPVEFTISPEAGSVRAMSDVTIKLTLCSNTVKRYRLALVVDVEGVGEEIVTLPIKARCVVPDIVVETPVLDFQRCFLDRVYEQQVRLTNTSSLPACYCVLDQETEESPSVIFGSSKPKGVLYPGSSQDLPVFLLAKKTGRQHQTLCIAVFGSLHPPLSVSLSCIGQGPIVHVQNPQLDFGTIPVLKDITQTLHLSNQSPIPACFTAQVCQKKPFWRVEPAEGEVPPESHLELKVVAHLKDTLLFQARLELSIQHSQTHTILLSATGTGTTIVSDKPFAPSLDLGTYLSHETCQYHFKLTNHGQRVHRLYWGIDGFLSPSKTCNMGTWSSQTLLPPISAPNQKESLDRLPLLSRREHSVFSLRPAHVELFPGCSADMVLTGSSDSPKDVRERFVCHGIVGHFGCKKNIMSVDITCRFVAPMLSFSSKQLNYYIQEETGESLLKLYKKLILKNVSSLSLSMEFSLKEPFYLCEAPRADNLETNKSMVLGDKGQAELWVCFNPANCQDRMSQVVDQFLEIHYQGHPQQDKVHLHAEVHFPNLHFSSTNVDFGCVLNCAETQKIISITNCSPLPVSYHWAFLEDQEHHTDGAGVKGHSSTQSSLLAGEVFDVSPVYGHLQPGEEQLVTFFFFGHKNISRELIAQCHVEKGPTYDITLKGEASDISYTLDSTLIDFGLLLFDHIGEAQVTLKNTGKMGFKFRMIDPQLENEEEDEEAGGWTTALEQHQLQSDIQQQNDDEENGKGREVRPGQPVAIPNTGYIAADSELCLRVLYLPGVPEVFRKQLQLQVAFLQPQDITLSGEGVFPRISLNLPQILSEESYSDVVQQAKAAVEADKVRETLRNGNTTGGGEATTASSCTLTYEELLYMEIERALVKQNALAVSESLLELTDSQLSSVKWQKLSKFLLPEYVLDFGFVIPGKVHSQAVNITNTGSVAVSFHANSKRLAGTGFSTDFERVKNLPCREAHQFTVKFDPQGANLPMGNISVVMPIQVTGGPTVQVQLCAVVTVPTITASTDTLQFDKMQCGMCQIKIIQLFNREPVLCHWSISEEVKPFKKVDKFLPLYKRKKALQEQRPPPAVFEMNPNSGILSPGEKVNVQIKFSPVEGKAYSRKLVVEVAEGNKQVLIKAQGQAEEPHLEFCPSVLELDPCLPLSTEAEAEVIVQNPCSFPIEFYCLELDTGYLNEEKILRQMQGYDENNILLLPPRVPGESLPTELLDYYEEYCFQPTDDGLTADLDEKTSRTVQMQERSSKQLSESKESEASEIKHEEVKCCNVRPAELFISEMTCKGGSEILGQLEMTPVSRAIARHMCIDLTPEGLAARNRRGIAIIVYGAPLTGKSSTAAALAHHYRGTCLSVDAVITDALMNGTSPVCLNARQLYDSAAAEYAKKKAEEAVQAVKETSTPSAYLEASDPLPYSVPPPHDAVEGLERKTEDCCSRNYSKPPRETNTSHIALRMGGDMTTLRNLLPEQLLVDILEERFQQSDCYRGIVINCLDSVYTQSEGNTIQVVLKALNNRKHIYVINLSDSYAALKARERAQRETDETLEKQWLQELDEEQYEFLSEEAKERLDQQQREKLRQLKLRRELQKQKEKEAEEKRLQEKRKRLREEEEELKRKSKKGAKKDSKDVAWKRSLLEGRKSTDALNGQRLSSRQNSKESLVDSREQHNSNEVHHSKEGKDLEKQITDTEELHVKSPPRPTDKLEQEQSCVDELQLLFRMYEQSQEQVENVLQHWDRAQGVLLIPKFDETAADKHTPVGKRTKKPISKTTSPMPSQTKVPAEADKTGEKVSRQDPIPQIVLNVTGKDYPSATALLKVGVLPPLAEVLDDLGLGPSGPPIPPPTTLSVVPFPKQRKQSCCQLTCDCFTFLVPSGLDEQGEEKNDSEDDVPDVKEEISTVSTRRRGWGNVKESTVTVDKDKAGRENQRSKIRSAAKTKIRGLRSPLVQVSPRSDSTEQDQNQQALELKRNQRLSTFRWVVPAHGEVCLKIWFYSQSPGKFEQIFNFELLGTKRNYQLICRGNCTYPSICKDYKALFSHSKKVQQVEEGLQKTYVIKPAYFEFGPLLCGKTRDRYKENRYPENTEKLVIHNNSGLEAEVQFSFQHDIQAATYLLDPPTMTLKPGQKKDLIVWAYPTKEGQIKDSIVCNIKDNPEPVIIKLSCWGVRPELVLESKHLHFDRILTYRQDSRSVTLHNKTALPVSWRLHGVEELGDEFTVPQDQGIIPPNSSFPLILHFRSQGAVLINRILRLEVSDVEMIVGIQQTENIQVTAEAYTISLDILPEFLNFGTIKVSQEAKLSLRMKNKGKYEIAYNFTFQQTDPSQANLDSMFTVTPQSGTLMPHEKPTSVQITCRPTKEVLLKEQPVLPCQVIEPNTGNGGETINILYIKVSVQALFSRYKITPACEMNFGPLNYGSKKSQCFTIENSGHFETRFSISHMTIDPAPTERPGFAGKNLLQNNHSRRLTGNSCRDMSPTPNCFTLGVFSVSPCTGILQPGSQQVVTVECPADQLGIWYQVLLIDISDRDPSDQPDGIQYTLLADVCKPGIDLDVASIFEEYHLCNNRSQLISEQFLNAEGIYVREENKFFFNKVLVGRTAQARFKLINSTKVPCVLSLAIKHVGTKILPNLKVFDMATTTLNIPSQSHSFAVVTFSPQKMQLYSAMFKVTLEETNRKAPILEFDLMGEGNLPSVCVERPTLTDKRGQPILHFRRVLVGRRQTLPLVLLNNGTVPAKVMIDMLDKHQVFTLRESSDNTLSSIQHLHLEGTANSEHQSVHRTTLTLNVNKRAEFDVSFCPDKPLTVKAKMSLQVEDNEYSSAIIKVTGEAYQEIVSLDNIRRSHQEMDQDDEEGGCYESLDFGDCYVDFPSQESFTMTNHSSNWVVKFEWPPAGPHVSFSPQVGHLHAGCSKEVTVTFCSNQPVTLSSQPMSCKLCQVEFQEPLEEVADWDDRQRTVQWSSDPQQPGKKKEIKTDPEPSCAVVERSQWEKELRITAVCDYVKFSCNTDNIHFRDTMLYQSRLHQMQIVNHGNVQLDFSWQVLIDTRNSINQDQGAGEPTSQSNSRSAGVSGARPTSALSSVMSLMIGNPELPPFSIEPKMGAIQPGDTENFSICFSPLEVAQFKGRLVCSISNLQDSDQSPSVLVCGRSQFPNYHIDLKDSDYINRRNPDFRGHLDPNIRIIEFNVVGLNAPSIRCFSVLNPTSKPYSFKWRCEDTADSPFRCLTPCGSILPGKKVEVGFEYVPEQLDAVESFWSFVIETLSLSIPFLCVGTTREPLVYLDRAHLDFGELLIGYKVDKTVDLVNGEDEPFHFSVSQSSLVCDDQESTFVLQPMTGTLAPKNRLPLSLSFKACREGCLTFRLVVKVRSKSEPLTLTVKANCFTVYVQVQNPDGGLREAKPNHHDSLDFGEIEIVDRSIFSFLLSHPARFSLNVNFDLTGPSDMLQHLEAKPQNATLEFGEPLQSSLLFSPQSICSLQDVKLHVRIKHGPIFTFAISGRAVASSLQFSFSKFNFGKCFLYSPGVELKSQTLVISNKGTRDDCVQCQFKNTSYLEVDFQPQILSPGAVMEVPVRFYPCEVRHYHEKLNFIVNSGVTKQVDILGQGIERKLEVQDPKQRKVKLGSLILDQTVKKQVVLVNRSPLDMSFTLLLNTNTPTDPMLLRDLTFTPAGELSLRARGGTCNVEIQFSPRQHVPPFSAELQAEFPGLLHPLLTIQGRCKVVEVKLNQDHLVFGAVVQGCRVQKKIIMMNTGDTGAWFLWKTDKFPSELSISPAKGYIPPDREVLFEVTFAPVELSNDIRHENICCCVEGISTPVTLTVTGSCIIASISKEVVTFVCPVRGSHTQSLSIVNPTNQQCSIRPVIEGEQWSAEPSVTLEPFQKETYRIIYRPLTMTVEKKKHLGSVFFSFPDGSGSLYSLQGTAEPPQVEDTILHELPAKTHHTQLLPVHNWLSKQQRFCVLMEILKPEKTDATVSLKGLEYIDVPALAERQYKMSFFSYREGQFITKVTFRNTKSGEFLFYLVTFKATTTEILSAIELETSVRRTVSATVLVENPLTSSVCLETECSCPDISAPTQHTVPAQSKSSLSFEYLPLCNGESTARLSLSSPDLGYFHYDLLLRALPAPPEKTVHFNTSLGSSQSIPIKFINYSRSKTEYFCKTNCPDFIVGKKVEASPGSLAGSEASVEVCFEPHHLGEVRGQLNLSSGSGGEYIFPLHGICLPPKAQGPFSIKDGSNTIIPFKNVLLQTTTFSFQVDNPCFTVKSEETMISKKTYNMLVSFDASSGGSAGPWVGKLTVSSERSQGHRNPISWVFYLNGYRQ